MLADPASAGADWRREMRVIASDFKPHPCLRKEVMMKLSVRALTLTAGLLWGSAVFLVALANLAWPDYGRAFLEVIASIYPGVHPGSGVTSVLMATIYALADGAIAGAVFGWIYNWLSGAGPSSGNA